MMDDNTEYYGSVPKKEAFTKMMILKHCPFCGGKAKLIKSQWGYKDSPVVTIRNQWTVKCTSCSVDIGIFTSEIYEDDEGHLVIDHDGPKEAVNAWNRRAETRKE